MSYRFEIKDIPVETTDWVRERIGAQRGGWIYGPLGSGKTHAVEAAAPGAIRVDVTSGSATMRTAGSPAGSRGRS